MFLAEVTPQSRYIRLRVQPHPLDPEGFRDVSAPVYVPDSPGLYSYLCRHFTDRLECRLHGPALSILCEYIRCYPPIYKAIFNFLWAVAPVAPLRSATGCFRL